MKQTPSATDTEAATFQCPFCSAEPFPTFHGMSSHARGRHAGSKLKAWLKIPKEKRMADTRRDAQRGATWEPVSGQPIRASVIAGTSGSGQRIPPSDQRTAQDPAQMALSSYQAVVASLGLALEQASRFAGLTAQAQAGYRYCLSMGLDVEPPPTADAQSGSTASTGARQQSTPQAKSGRRQSRTPTPDDTSTREIATTASATS